MRSEFLDSKEIKGPIYKMLDEVEIFFQRNTRLANKIVEFKRVDIPEYPFEAIREAVINAIAHRDYTFKAPIMFSIFDDRIEISNPGDKILDLVSSIPKERQTDLRELGLNNRQIEVLKLMVNDKKTFTINQYIKKFYVTDKTARMDLKELVSKDFIEKIGKTKGTFFKAKTILPK